MLSSLKKIPSSILIIDNLSKNPNYNKKSYSSGLPSSTILHFSEDPTQKYDLVFLCDLTFSFHLSSPLPICESEIVFKRSPMSLEIFLEGLWHYSECEIRNGK
ncbi:hypothetical protein NGRA_1321 [Nosema granulosis]|uniref:Uncharacterized protein n=1 Tax=Nosema granulosis TaxID=83296 RepID=A0A9P6GZP5_9MICR|nr:hypothetical protein NGRA_1321 [Nosema granulosis]